jgi:hypothetical protein
MDSLPDDLSYRFRTWAIGKSADAPSELINRELIEAISTRRPTDDDRTLIERVADEDFDDPSWRDALGDAPTPAEVGQALNERNIPPEWVKGYDWSALLPDNVIGDQWRTAVSILSAAWGQPSAEMFRPRASVEFESSRSPLDVETLAAMTPEAAAEWIGKWRSTDWMVTARELGRTLQEVVKTHPQSWGADPIRIASSLIHPTYIHHYLAGLSQSGALSELDAEKLMQLVSLVRTHPWEAAVLGGDSFDFDADWRSAEEACVDLIKALADADAGFGQSEDDAWTFLVAKVDDRQEDSAILDDDTDYLELAINRPCTRALDAALSFLGYEFRLDGAVALERLDVLTRSLRLTGSDGAQHRALIVTKLGFLSRIAPQWLEQQGDEMFGQTAPHGLAQRSIDLALKWGLPNSWLMEHYAAGVVDAVRRGVHNALEHYLIATLREVPGYDVRAVAQRLRAIEQLSDAGESVGRLLRGDDVTPRLVELCIDFWREAITAGGELKGFGWMSEVDALPADTWAELTLETLKVNSGRIDWAQQVAERLDESGPTTTGLAIFNHMVRSIQTPWDTRSIGERARQYLTRASGLSDSDEYSKLQTALSERGM